MTRIAFHPATVPLKTLSTANDTVQAGRYEATTLSAVDTDLTAGNIKNGIVIFGKSGSTNVRDSTDADAGVGDVKDPKTFYAGGGAKKTGTMPTVAIVAANDNYPAGYHAGHAGGLDSIDPDLAPGNIKADVTIFGFVGTYSQAIAHDDADEGLAGSAATYNMRCFNTNVNPDAEVTWCSTTVTCLQATILEGYYFASVEAGTNNMKLQFYMDGVMQSESIFITGATGMYLSDMAWKAVASGDRVIYVLAHNYGLLETLHVAGACFGAACKVV